MPDGRGGIPARRPASGLLAGRLGSRLVLGLALLPARLHLRADLGDLGLVDAAVLVGVDPVEMLRGARGAGRLRFGARDHAVGIGVEMLEHRSEERRVGKECGSPCSYRWARYNEK